MDAKTFVGNLAYDVNGEKFAMLFEKAGIAEIPEVIFDFIHAKSLHFSGSNGCEDRVFLERGERIEGE